MNLWKENSEHVDDLALPSHSFNYRRKLDARRKFSFIGIKPRPKL